MIPVHRFTSVLALVVVASALGCVLPPLDTGSGAEPPAASAPDQEAEGKPAGEPDAPAPEELASALPIHPAPGELVQVGTTDDPAEPGLGEQSAGYQGMTWAPLQTGASKLVAFSLGLNENLDVRLIPTSGDADVELYKGTTLVQSSRKGTGFVDRVGTVPYDGHYGPDQNMGPYTVRFYCYSGPCAFGSFIGIGDKTAFTAGTATYLNQRSWTTVNKKCKFGSTWVADGECMCSDTSAATSMASLGKIKIANARTVASDLFNNTNYADGAANRWALMGRLKSTYGFGTCTEDTNTSNVAYHIRRGRLVLLRSSKFSDSGHYVAVRGFRETSGVTYVEVDDPYGAWTSNNTWSPKNTTSTSSKSGEWRTYRLSSLSSGGSLIVCY